MKSLLVTAILGASLIAINVQANPAVDLQKCEDLRPRACGQPGTPSCKSVQEQIDACKQRVREEAGRNTNKKK